MNDAAQVEETVDQPAEQPEAAPHKAAPVDSKKIQGILKANMGARMRSWLSICARCGLCTDSCFFYLANNRDPKFSPAYKVKTTLGELVRKKGEVDRAELERIKEVAWGQCTVCRRCSMYCPFGIDMASMIGLARACCTSQGVLPEGLAKTRQNIIETGNQMAMANEDWVDTCEWMAEEYAEETAGLTVPVDVAGAKYMYTVNPREPMYYPQDIGMMAQILTVAEEDWTVPTKGWDCTNLAMFASDKVAAAIPVKLMYDAAVELGVEQILVTECGHAYRSAAFEGPYFVGAPGGNPPVPIKHSVQLFWEYIVRDKRIIIDPDKMPDVPVTLQDPCNVSRNGGLWQMLRELAQALVKDFRDMSPNREYNHCCGGGGGFIPMGAEYKKRRMISGQIKAEQIRKTGAEIIISPCHNCFDQLNDLNKEYDLGVKVLSFKELIVESMVVPDKFIPPEDDDENEEEAGAETTAAAQEEIEAEK